MKHYQVTMTGKTPLLMHADDIDWADEMERWKNDPHNKKSSKAGDDRSPAWRWVGHVYRSEECVSMPQENIMRCLMEGGAQVPVPGGKMGKTFKAQSQSGMGCQDFYWPIEIDGKRIAASKIEALTAIDDFTEHRSAVSELGFDLFVKRAKVGSSKHVRVRARLRNWTLQGVLLVWDKQISKDALQSILEYAGEYKGLGDWRPGGRTPGPYGRFDARVDEVK